jgi:hypothetical protein
MAAACARHDQRRRLFAAHFLQSLHRVGQRLLREFAESGNGILEGGGFNLETER